MAAPLPSPARATAGLLAGVALLGLAGPALPQASVAAKALGALLLLAAAGALLRGADRASLPDGAAWDALRLGFAPVAALAGWSALSLLWTLDPGATHARATHLAMEASLVGAVVVLAPAGLRGLGLGGAAAAVVLAAGFGLEALAPEGARLRPFGVHPNLVARDAALGALLALSFARMPRWASVGVSGAAGLAVGLSFSSGAALAGVGAVAVLALRRRWRAPVAALLAGAILGGATLAALEPDRPRLRSPATALRGDAVEEIGSGRLVLWGHALRVAAAHPALGAGAGAFPAAMEPIRVEHQRRGGEHSKPRRRAHSSFLDLLAETGPVGLALLAVPLLALTRRAWRARDEVAGALVVFVTLSAATDSLLSTRGLWLGFVAAVLAATRPLPPVRRGAAPRTSEPPSPPPTT